MRIEAHLIAWNESEIIGMVISHYKKFCDHVTIWDNYSTDSTQLIAESMGCDVKKFGKKGELSDQAYLDVKNNCWRGSDADFVVVCDADEILFADPVKNDIKSMLLGTEYAIHKPFGWNVYSDSMPHHDLLEITNGYPFANYSKCVLFNPSAVSEIGFKPGAHACEPVYKKYTMEGILEHNDIFLLHYKNIGGVDRLLKRNQEYRNRMSYQNKKMGWGKHYYDSEATVRREWAERLAKSKPLL